MKIFVTGGTGFIGSHFLNHVAASRHEVIALNRGNGSCCVSLGRQPKWLVCPMDEVRHEHLLGCNVLVHLASVGVSPKVASWDELFYWNVTVTLKLAQAAKEAGVKRIVAAGTFAEYGTSADRFDPIPPDAPLEPTSGYAASKAAACLALASYALEQGLELSYLRIFSAYGEGQYKDNFWPSLRAAALAGADFEMTPGEQVRDYIPVEKVADAFWAEVEAWRSQRIVVRNLGTGRPVSMKDFASKLWLEWGAKGKLKIGALPYRPNEVMRFVPQV